MGFKWYHGHLADGNFSRFISGRWQIRQVRIDRWQTCKVKTWQVEDLADYIFGKFRSVEWNLPQVVRVRSRFLARVNGANGGLG